MQGDQLFDSTQIKRILRCAIQHRTAHERLGKGDVTKILDQDQAALFIRLIDFGYPPTGLFEQICGFQNW